MDDRYLALNIISLGSGLKNTAVSVPASAFHDATAISLLLS